tara:strand:+ start:4811 stop:6031 length:1221 start_codon:yes stop_codon:yes gene_type:complete
VKVLYLADIRFPLERANGLQTMRTCGAVADRGHHITLVVRVDTRGRRRDPFAFYSMVKSPHFELRQCNVRGLPPIRRASYLAMALACTMRVRRTSIVISRDLGVVDLLLRLPRTLRPPIIYESHGFAPTMAVDRARAVTGAGRVSEMKQRRLVRRERRVWHSADGYVSTTRALRNELDERFGPRECVAVIPNGVTLHSDRRLRPPPLSAAPTVAYAGHLYPWKGVDVLLGALALLPEARGAIIGGNPNEQDLGRLRSLAREIGIADRVTFVGMVEPHRVRERLLDGDVLVVPTLASPFASRYTSPLKLFEYMEVGKPIVASDLPSIREVLRDGANAVLVTPGDAGALADGLRRVLTDQRLANAIARQAFDDAALYGWDRRAERLEQLFGEVLAKCSLPPTAGVREA